VAIGKRESPGVCLKVNIPLTRVGVTLASGAVFFFLAGVAVVLAKTLYRSDHVYGLYALFDLDSDSSIPTWFSSLGLLICSVLLCLNSIVAEHGRRIASWQWRFLAVVFLLLSIDEVARMHEILGTLLGQELVPDISERTDGILSYQWLVVAIAFTGLLLLACIPFLCRLPRRIAVGLMLAGAVYVGGAVAMESINGNIARMSSYHSSAYMWGTAFEEFLEMLGVALFAHVLVCRLDQRVRSVSLVGNLGSSADAAC